MRRAAALPMIALVAAGACRDTTGPFVSDDRPEIVRVVPRRVTYSGFDDRAPTWNATSDSIYYAGYSEDLLPDAPATLLANALDGGIARLVLHNAQVGADVERWFLAPSREPNGNRIAYVDLEPLDPYWLCDEWEESRCTVQGVEPPSGPAFETARLVAATLRVRRLTETAPLDLDPLLTLDLRASADTASAQFPGMEAYAVHLLPYQAEFSETRAYPFRPAWSPDGSRIAASDGRRIMIWQPANGVVDTVPGTHDGMAPSWSPDGAHIAFMWTERLDSIQDRCHFGYEGPLPPFGPPPFITRCLEYRTAYTYAAPRIVTISADGGDRTIVADGREPLWLPDGRILYAAVSGFPPEALRIIDPATGEMTLLVGTEGAREPALSPDGRRLAYTRWFGRRTDPRDVYVVELP